VPEDFIQLPSEPFGGLETAKSKARKRKEEAVARKAFNKAKREGDAGNGKQVLSRNQERRRNKQAKNKAKKTKQKQKGNS
jgi:hypothetical protein